MSEVNIHVGYDAKAVKARVLEAVRRAESGQTIGEAHVTFESWEGLSKVLTNKRLALLRHLHGQPAESIADLARVLGRDYKRVHEDVEILSTAGLIERSDSGAVKATFDEIRASIDLAQSAA
jgi:predicted transcriptional regulator